MKALLLAVVLCSASAFAQDVPMPDPLLAGASDAPVLNPYPEGKSAIVLAGDLIPFEGLLLDNMEAHRREWAAQRDLGELNKLKEKSGHLVIHPAIFVSIVVAVAVVVAAGTTAAILAAQKKTEP